MTGERQGPISTAAAPPAELILTGERTLPGIPDENYWFRRHEAAYLAFAPWVCGARVLEAGVGEGYGAHLLQAAGADTIVGVDYDQSAASHVARKYAHVRVVQGDLQRLPVRSGSVEVIAHLQTIEHLHDQPGFVAECARVLRPGGTLLVSTPNRLTFSPGRSAPLNPFHTRELAPDELTDLLGPHFRVVRQWGVHHGRGLRNVERRVGPLIDAQIARAPADWNPAVRTAVHAVTAADFTVRGGDLDDSLDLAYVCWRTG